MTTHYSDPVTLSHMLRLAFRATFLTRFDALLSKHEDSSARSEAHDAFLGQLPLLRGCAPQVELEILFATWQKISAGELDELDELEQCVCYCAVGLLANTSERRDTALLAQASDGKSLGLPLDCIWLTSQLRTLQMIWPVGQDDSALLTQDLLSESRLDELDETSDTVALSRTNTLGVLGQWQVSYSIFSNAAELLTSSELLRLRKFFAHNPRLISV